MRRLRSTSCLINIVGHIIENEHVMRNEHMLNFFRRQIGHLIAGITASKLLNCVCPYCPVIFYIVLYYIYAKLDDLPFLEFQNTMKSKLQNSRSHSRYIYASSMVSLNLHYRIGGECYVLY